MNHYDIVFIGQAGKGTIFPFQGFPFVEKATPVIWTSMAASGLGKRIAVVTRISEGEECLLEPLKKKGVDLFMTPGKTIRYRIVFPTNNVDQRQHFRESFGEPFAINDIPPFEPCLIHLCCIGHPQAQLELMRALRGRGFRLSVDMQSFMLQDDENGAVHLKDISQKKEIVTTAEFVKLDIVEARTLTGAEVPQDQAEILESWGSSETILTSSDGVLARSNGKTTNVKFSNKITRGRMGRGDTVIASYLACRLDHSVEESLRFAAALASIKLESPGPFVGSLNDVVARINGDQ